MGAIDKSLGKKETTRRSSDDKSCSVLSSSERAQVQLPVVLELAPGNLIDAVMEDVSSEGFRLRSEALLHAGQPLKIHLGGQSTEAEVRWSDGVEAGGVFTNGPTQLSWPGHRSGGGDRIPRRALQSRGFAILDDGSVVSVKILDLSYSGCKVEPDRSLKPGSKIKLAVVGVSGSAEATVRWCSNGRAGLQFTPEAQPERAHVERRHERLQITARLTLRRFGRQHYQARLFDLTPAGCKVEFIERPKCNEVLWVKFAGLDSIEAKVCWVDGFYGGLSFLRPLYSAVFDMLIERLKNAND